VLWGTVELVAGDGRLLMFRPDSDAVATSFVVAKEFWLDDRAVHVGSDSPTSLTAGHRAQIATIRCTAKTRACRTSM